MSVRVYELAKELGLSNKELLSRLKELKVEVASHSSSLNDKTAAAVREKLRPSAPAATGKPVTTLPRKEAASKEAPPKEAPPKEAARKVEVPTKETPGKEAAPKEASRKEKIRKEIPPKAAPKKEVPVKEAVPKTPPGKEALPKAEARKETSRKEAPPKETAPKETLPKEAPRKEIPPKAALPKETPKKEAPRKEIPPVPEKHKEPETETIKEPEKEIKVKLPITVKELAIKLDVKAPDLIKGLMKERIMVNINQSLNEEMARRAAKKFNYNLVPLPTEEELLIQMHQQEDKSRMVPRAPIVTMMGHVDHGKTSLLDAIRKTNVTAQEAGGITQHIGAYEVMLAHGQVTFLDTPGHEAFTAMRARGANITDIVVLVVAADDGIMPQTTEAIDHARAAEVPIVVAINKIDLPAAQADRVKRQLSEIGLASEDWGGKTIAVEVSAKTGQGIDRLLEMILLEAEMLELKADPGRPARGAVVEGRLSPGRGPVATVLVQNGTLKVGDVVLAGNFYGRIRALINDRGGRVESAPPSTPVELLGLNGVPQAGEPFYAVVDEKKAREIAARRTEEKREREQIKVKKVTLEDLHHQIKEGKLKELDLIIKGDVRGSVEAIQDSLKKLSTPEVAVKIIHSGVGAITESDVMLASVCNAVIIGFHVEPDPAAVLRAEREGVEIKIYRIIYETIDNVRKALEGLLEPELNEVPVGRLRVKQVFEISGVGVIAGGQVIKGKVVRNFPCRLLRAGKIVFQGSVSSLKRFKNDARQVEEGFECGLSISNWKDIQVDDEIECFQIEKVERKLA